MDTVKTRNIGFGALFIACILVACVSLSQASELVEPGTDRLGVTDTEVVIGSCVPLTGTLQERGKEIALGASLFFNYINDQGGVNGRKIKLTTCDDAYDPDKAIECFNNCLKGKVFAAAFFAGSAPISKYVRLGEMSRMPMMGFCTGVPTAYDFRPTQFTFRPSYADEVEKQVDVLWRLYGIRRVGIVYQNDAGGAAVRGNVIKMLKRFGGGPVAEASFTRKTTDIDEPIREVRQANPQAIVFSGTNEGLLAFVSKRAQQKWKCLTLTFSIADDYLAGVKEADGMVVTQVVPPLDNKLAGYALYVKLLHKHAPSSQPNLSAFEAFLNAEILVEGLKRAGRDLTRTGFIKALETLQNFDPGAGPGFKVSYSKTNHNGLNSKAVYFMVMRDGKLVPMSDVDWKQLVDTAKGK